MPTAFDALTGRDVDTASEEWRHNCECRWLLANKPTKATKHLYLYGTDDRKKLMVYNKAGLEVLASDYRTLRTSLQKPLMDFRGLAGADRLLADARRLHELK